MHSVQGIFYIILQIESLQSPSESENEVPDEEVPKEESKEELTEPEGLKILTAANFDTFLSQTEHVIVMFFAPCE